MKLKVFQPSGVRFERDVTKIVAEGENGSFGLEPRHVDFVAALVPGILRYEKQGGGEGYLAVHNGILVKRGSEALVATLHAVSSSRLESLSRIVEEHFETMDEREKKTLTAVSRLEANLVRRFTDIEKQRVELG
jgi:F-type H+-transporting ATPase subunit epsilon